MSIQAFHLPKHRENWMVICYFHRVSTQFGVWLLAAMITAGQARAQWVDHFQEVCGLSAWSDVQVTEGWDIQAFEGHDISVTRPGHLTLMPYTVSWYADWRGPLLYRMVSGDFVLTGRVSVTNRAGTGLPESAYSLAGFMVRNPKALTTGPDGWMPGEEDYVFLSVGNASAFHPSCPGCPAPHLEVKTTNNSQSVLEVASVDTAHAEIRVVRLHPYVLVLYRFPGAGWSVHQRYSRADLADTVQVGMVAYTDWDKVSTYTDIFHNSHVLTEELDPDPSSNPGLPFAPDLIGAYDWVEWLPASLPPGWAGIDLLDELAMPDDTILGVFGDILPVPGPPAGVVWRGHLSADWSEAANWMNAAVPGPADHVVLPACDCPAAHCAVIPAGPGVAIGGLTVHEGATLTVPAGAVLEITGPFVNEGILHISGQLIVHASVPVENRGQIECLGSGVLTIWE